MRRQKQYKDLGRSKRMKAESTPNLGVMLVGGLLATPAMTVAMYMLAPVLGMNTDIVAMLSEALGGWKMGMLVHILNGAVIFPAIFALLLYRFLPGPPIVKGSEFGFVLWLASQAAVMPLMGAGFFSSHIGGLKAVMASLFGHLVYGSLLGVACLVQFLAQETSVGNDPQQLGISGQKPKLIN
jgi:uncharacterized membrane protein YagU involved in acid resistance